LGLGSGAGAVKGGADTLVIVDGHRRHAAATHSMLWTLIRDEGHTVEFVSSDDAHLSVVTADGKLAYSNLVYFAPAAKGFADTALFGSKQVLQFVDLGGSVLIAADSYAAGPVREIAAGLGFELDEVGTAVIDHHHTAHVEGDAPFITTAKVAKVATVVGDVDYTGAGNSIAYRGVGMSIDRLNLLAMDILNAESTAYSYKPAIPMSYYPFAVGQSVTLIGGLQAHNQARAVIIGSIDALSDAVLAKEEHGNAALAARLVPWTLGCSGKLRVAVRHLVVKGAPDTGAGDTEFVAQDTLELAVVIEECFRGEYAASNASRIQMELVRGDVFVRKMLTSAGAGGGEGTGRFTAEFVLPREQGTYKLHLHATDLGYTLDDGAGSDVMKVVVRPPRRAAVKASDSGVGAMPYYAAMCTTIASTLLLGGMLFRTLPNPTSTPTPAPAPAQASM